MLTDIFARRYEDVPLWHSLAEADRRFLVQSFTIVSEQLYPPYHDGKEIEATKAVWQSLHGRLSRELGVVELSQKEWGYWWTAPAGNQVWQSRLHSLSAVCKNFALAEYKGEVSEDRFMKERMSFIELAFREKDQEIAQANAALPGELQAAKKEDVFRPSGRLRIPGSRADAVRSINERKNQEFRAAVDELNIRMRQAKYDLHYHNGLIQISTDRLVESQIEQPFWSLVAGPLWKNIDIDMKEAIDSRDNNGRDPAFYAANSLESFIKIISDQKGWTHGKEKGASNYVDNLLSKRDGHFITSWESDMLKAFFKFVRNPFGHGPGSAEMPTLNPYQTDWAIEFCMTWIKNLIRRM